jgi:8-oxo-dGTP pyrophosphatase MutT (NUDIX family)
VESSNSVRFSAPFSASRIRIRRWGSLSTAFQQIKRRLFWVLSRSAMATYSRLPLFGWLHCSVGVIRKGQLVLVIDRADGRGLSFPGGLAVPWETAEQAMKREVSEETGLRVKYSTQLFEYRSSTEIPVVLAVFAVEAEGELKDSWEGSPRWLPFTDIRSRLLPSQREIVDRLL